jgi:hypothetical protein
MPIVTKSQVLRFATRDTLAKADSADHILKEEAMTKRASYDIFLSHSYDDRKIILGAKRFIESKGYSVFVDWIEEPKLNRNKVNKATAAALRAYMDISRCLIYAYSPSVGNSKWCPWELGYFDGKNGRAYVMPIIDDPLQSYTGVEYVSLYPNVTEEQAKNGNMNLYVVIDDQYVWLSRAIRWILPAYGASGFGGLAVARRAPWIPRAGFHELFLIRRFLAKPFRPVVFRQDDRHAVMQLADDLIGGTGQDRAAQHGLALWRFPFRPQPGHDHLPVIGHGDRVGLLLLPLGIEFFPFIEAVGDDEAPLAPRPGAAK